MVGRRRVVERQHNACEELNADPEDQDAAEREPPAGARRQRLVERMPAKHAKAGTVVEPVDQLRADPQSSTSISEDCGFTRTFNGVSPAGGGPATTRPSRS